MSTWLSDRRTIIVAAALAILGASIAVVQLSAAAFTATTTSAENSWASGSVTISDNMAGAAAFTVTDMVPGQTEERCIVVTYTGSVAADVKTYVTEPTTPGDQLLTDDLTVDLQSGADLAGTSGTDGDCTGFVPDDGLVYDVVPATLATLITSHGDFATGLTPAWTVTSGGVEQQRTYRISVTLEETAAQSAGATALFNWEARSTAP